MAFGQIQVIFNCVSENTFCSDAGKECPASGWRCVFLGSEGIALLQMLQLLTENLRASVLWLSIYILEVLISKMMLITLSNKGGFHNNLVTSPTQQLNANSKNVREILFNNLLF